MRLITLKQHISSWGNYSPEGYLATSGHILSCYNWKDSYWHLMIENRVASKHSTLHSLSPPQKQRIILLKMSIAQTLRNPASEHYFKAQKGFPMLTSLAKHLGHHQCPKYYYTLVKITLLWVQIYYLQRQPPFGCADPINWMSKPFPEFYLIPVKPQEGIQVLQKYLWISCISSREDGFSSRLLKQGGTQTGKIQGAFFPIKSLSPQLCSFLALLPSNTVQFHCKAKAQWLQK